MHNHYSHSKLTILVSYSGSGGVEVVTNHLVEGLLKAGVQIDLLLIKARGPHVAKLPAHPLLRVIKLKRNSAWLAVPELIRYFRQPSPGLVLAIKDRAIQAASLANIMARSKMQIVGQLHNNMQTGLSNRNAMGRHLRFALMRYLYRQLRALIAVSQDAADAIQHITRMPNEKIFVASNPVLTPTVLMKANQPPEHPWLKDKTAPVLVSVGRLSPQKNYSLLLKAFSHLQATQPCRLVIFGEGPLRQQLEREAQTLGITEHVSLPGYVENPYAELQQADMFVLCSDWEGSPTVLIEAMGLGLPCVATRVGDTHVTMQDGKIGKLVPTGDENALLSAMQTTLISPLSASALKQAVEKFDQTKAVEGYLQLLQTWGLQLSAEAPLTNQMRQFHQAG